MPSCRYLLICVCLGAVLALSLSSTALATSAGDQQYIDPLSGSTPSGSGAGSPSSGSSGSPGSSSAVTASSGSSSSGSSSSGSSSSTAASSGSSGATTSTAVAGQTGTLPRTGLDVPLAVALGMVLASGGFLLRRTVRRAE